MTSSKILSKRLVNHLLNSILKDHSKCQICSSNRYTDILANYNSGGLARSGVASATFVQFRRNFSAVGGGGAGAASEPSKLYQSSDIRVNDGGTSSFKSPSKPLYYRASTQINTRRLSSTAATVTSLKRDASTQAQQHQEEEEAEAELSDRKYYDSFRSSELEIVKCSPGELRQKPSIDKLVFGHAFTDHMFRVDWSEKNGWTVPLISKVHNIDIHPAAKVLHYALEAFEGVKAFRGIDNKIRFFRLDQNIKRLQHSAKRLSLPPFDAEELTDCIHRLVHLDQDWIPNTKDPQQLTSLYLRPTILGVEPSLGVASSKNAILYVILSPVGPYFKTGFKPISLYADPDFVRAWRGGAGNTKLGSNYAPTIMVQKEAEKLGLQQVLWLYGDDAKLTEVGTMNIFVTYRNAVTNQIHLVTPPLTDGLILPGITRSSILELASQWSDVVCEERYVTIGEIEQLIHENRLVEMFGSGTACIVSPISSIQLKAGKKIHIPYTDITKSDWEGEALPMTSRILKAITDIQYGRIPHPWAKELRY